MKSKNLWIIISFLIVLIFTSQTLLWAEAQIKNITLQREGDYTNISILSDTPFQFNHFIEEKNDGKPYRIVIDCLDAIHSLPRSNFTDLPAGVISTIRTSQYQVSPQKICRVVIDLKNPVVYKVIDEGDSKVAKLALSTPDAPIYSQWSAVKTKGAEESIKSAQTKQAEKKIPVKEANVSEAVSKKIKPVQITETQQKKQDIKPSNQAVSQIKKEAEKSTTVNVSQKKLVPSPDEKKKIELAQKPKEIKTEIKSDLQVEKKKAEDTQVTAPEPADVEKTQERKEVPAGVTGKKMEEVPKRKILVYHSGEREDPFLPLTGKTNFTLGTVPLPSIEELKLVGVLEDNNGFKALLENELGFGYIMQSGDKIKNGVVVSIEKERVIFQVTEYGYTKNIALELFTPTKEER